MGWVYFIVINYEGEDLKVEIISLLFLKLCVDLGRMCGDKKDKIEIYLFNNFFKCILFVRFLSFCNLIDGKVCIMCV